MRESHTTPGSPPCTPLTAVSVRSKLHAGFAVVAASRLVSVADGTDMHTSDVAAYTNEFDEVKARSTSARDRAAMVRISALYAKWAALDRRVTPSSTASCVTYGVPRTLTARIWWAARTPMR